MHVGCFLVAFLSWGGETHPLAKFKDIALDQAFAPYLRAHPLLMEVAGAKIIYLSDGKRVLLSVGSTVLQDQSAQDLLRAEKVCQVHALRHIVEQTQGIQVFSMTRLKEETRMERKAGKESEKGISELLQITKTRVQGVARGMSVVGRWKSADGQTYYLAMGTLCDKDGMVLPSSPGK